MRILLRFREGFGLGDIVMAGVMLKHLRKYKPEWEIDCISQRGMHSALHGLCNRSWYEGEAEIFRYDFDDVRILDLDDSFTSYTDRPSNKTVHNLKYLFGLDYDAELGGYEVQIRPEMMNKAARWLRSIQADRDNKGAVVLHYQGGSSPTKKNLENWQADAIIKAIINAGRVPILIDVNSQSPFPNGETIYRVPDSVWGGFGNGDAETMAALIHCAEAFVGIDSGPAKVASSTKTPSLVIWTKNHPGRYHDPAANTDHLLPSGWSSMFADDVGRYSYFAAYYKTLCYRGEHGLVGETVSWIGCELRISDKVALDAGFSFVIPAHINSAVWCLAKMRSIAGRRPFDVIVAGNRGDEEAIATCQFLVETAIDVIRRVIIKPIAVHQGPEKPVNTRGHYLYVSDGWREPYHFLCPDAIMQLGKSVEEWLPDVPVDQEMVERLREAGVELCPHAAVEVQSEGESLPPK